MKFLSIATAALLGNVKADALFLKNVNSVVNHGMEWFFGPANVDEGYRNRFGHSESIMYHNEHEGRFEKFIQVQ